MKLLFVADPLAEAYGAEQQVESAARDDLPGLGVGVHDHPAVGQRGDQAAPLQARQEALVWAAPGRGAPSRQSMRRSILLKSSIEIVDAYYFVSRGRVVVRNKLYGPLRATLPLSAAEVAACGPRRASTAARSSTFSSSRTLPGHG